MTTILDDVPYERDPLSVRYDAMTGALLGRAYSHPGQWQYVVLRRPGHRGAAAGWLARHGIQLDATDSGGLTAWQRAFQRSLYWVHNGGGNGARNPVWSIQREWGPEVTGGRMFGVRASRPDVARRAVNRKPRGEQWWRHPEQQSGGQGSSKQRFG